jgi:hypothetical protein
MANRKGAERAAYQPGRQFAATWLPALVLVCVSVAGACPVYGQSNQERYMLQERCGKQAAATFKNEWGGNITKVESGQIIANYQNHYNERLNKCFYLEMSTTYQILNGKPERFKIMRLVDINENKEYATYLDNLCKVDETVCRSEQEFMQLIKTYMEN